MSSFLVAARVVVPMALMMAVGIAMRLTDVTDRLTMKKVDQIVTKVCMPLLMFKNIYTTDFSQFKGNTLKFVGGGSLFYSDVVFWISTMSEMEADYGILPNPKYNAEQEDYLASINAVATSMVIPYTASDLERTSVILQAMAQHSHYNMIETYYDEIVTVRNVRDPESREMINLAFENRVIDLCTVYDWGGFASTMKIYMVQNKNNIASLVDRLENKVVAKMEEYIESCNLDI